MKWVLLAVAPLARVKGLVRSVPLQRSGLRRKPPRHRGDVPTQRRPRGEFSARVKRVVFARDGACVPRICCTGAVEGLVVHHRANRGMGGSSALWISLPSNGLVACWKCNAALETFSSLAEYYAAGWKVRRGQLTPAEIPVLYPDGRWFLLSADGTRQETKEP